ncbi:LytTR family DNA-binding domain-containing protein [Pedobacter chitinilyticus]|uniref:LytTR family transcriptional regulator n=1 Tax=Pedobacter chitinilyticus TaxID=2233776 RepID=A0A3S4RR47_9SPHI|nr:LytTR family DNA-binding domain-containing protein [Pedobacter chitinilyticus]RWU08162.1 LytTR family transcriptional regulator [Pedobacter chitinilyticus]
MITSVSSKPVISYRDRAFRFIACLIGAHIIILLGEDISTFKAFTIKSYYPTLAINYAIALILAWIVRRVTMKLDRRFSWEENIWWRFILQLFFGVVMVSLICFLLVFIYFRSFGYSIMESDYATYQFPLSVALLGLLNAFYVVYYFYHRVRILSAVSGPAPSQYAAHIMVIDGRERINLPTGEIAYISLAGKESLVTTWEKKNYLVEHTLDELEGLLDPELFFRLNRRVIAHRAACRSYQPLEYGKLEVSLVPAFSEGATVSQRKAALFRQWIK